MSSNKENTNPKASKAVQNGSLNPQSSTAYNCTPGAVGLRRWQPPQAHMFVSTSASASGFSTVGYPPHADVYPTGPLQNKHDTSPVETRSRDTIAKSPLKVRKTRENLRHGFGRDTNSKSTLPALNPTNAKALKRQSLCDDDVATTPFSATVRPSLDTERIQVEAAIEQTAPNRTSVESNASAELSQPVQTLSRKLSVRKRVVSKVKGGLLSRSRSSSKVQRPLTDAVVNQQALSHARSNINTANERFQHSKEESVLQPPAFCSIQSFVPDDTDVETLPTSLLDPRNSPTRDIQDTPQRSHGSVSESPKQGYVPPSLSPEKTPRPARIPSEVPNDKGSKERPGYGPLHVRLTVVPAWDTLDLADEATMWAKIEAEATVSTLSMHSNTANTKPSRQVSNVFAPVVVVVIIDNSPFASPTALRNMSDIARRICSLLKGPQDRLAVFCTYCPHDSQDPRTTSGCRFHRLQAPNAASLSTDLERLERGPVTSPSALAHVSEMMQGAVLSVQNAEGETCQDHGRNTHAFVLSPLPQECTSILRRYVSWPVHQIQVGYYYEAPLPRDQTGTDGWSVQWEQTDEVILGKIVDLAREGTHVGDLSHVKVSINSTAPCQVEKLLTPARRATLRPGQRITLFAKVRIQSAACQDNLTLESTDDLYDGLQKTLGNFRNELFKTEVRYKHSSFPRSTELRTEQACVIQRTNRNSIWGAGPEKPGKDGLEIEIEKAKFAARNYTPDVATKILQKKFDNFWLDDNGPSALRYVREELEFQKRVLAEISDGSTRELDANITKRQSLSRAKRRTTLHLPDTEALQILHTAPSTPTFEDFNTSADSTSGEDLPDSTEQQSGPVEQDEARRIWRHMRRNSQTTSGPLSASEASSRTGSGTHQQQQQRQGRGSQESVIDRLAAADARLQEIRLKAIQNKRSVGAETLREFGMMQQQRQQREERGYECAPWL